jgi:hypothetical protein
MSSFFGSQPQYQPTIPTSAIQQNYGQAETGIANLPATQLGSNVLPLGQQTTSNLYNNPYAMNYQQGANTASGLGQNAALGAYGAGFNLLNAGQGLLPSAQQILQTGFDPQQALYNRTLQQVQDQSNVQNAMSGLSTSPYGAGIANQTLANFNIDWQNQQLNRQAQAAAAAGGLVGAGAGAINTGAGIANTAPGQYLQASGLPYGTYQGIGQDQMSNLQNLLSLGSGAQGLANLPITDLISLMGAGNQANQVAANVYGTEVSQQQNEFNQLLKMGQGMGGLLSMVPSFGGSSFFPSASFLGGGLGFG